MMSFFADKNQAAKGFKRIFKTLDYSKAGLKFAINEAAFRDLLILHSFLIIVSLFCIEAKNEKMILIVVSFLSLIVELFNSAIEATIDRISLEKHQLSKAAKDLGSAAQFLALILCFLTWVIVLFL